MRSSCGSSTTVATAATSAARSATRSRTSRAMTPWPPPRPATTTWPAPSRRRTSRGPEPLLPGLTTSDARSGLDHHVADDVGPCGVVGLGVEADQHLPPRPRVLEGVGDAGRDRDADRPAFGNVEV